MFIPFLKGSPIPGNCFSSLPSVANFHGEIKTTAQSLGQSSLFLRYLSLYFFSCVDNCDTKLNPSRRLALVGLCGGSTCGRGISYRWSLLQATSSNPSSQTDWFQVESLKLLIRTRLTSATIVTRPRVLSPDTLYKFVLTAKRGGRLSGYSEYKVVTNSPPFGGTCAVSPQSGVTLATEFTFTCANWQDADLPLQYEFIYFRNSDLLNVVYKGSKHTKEAKLPVGDKANNYTIDFRVRVGDMFRAFTEVKVSVQVSNRASFHCFLCTSRKE